MKDCPFCDGVRWRGHLDHCVLKHAADEIERLRTALALAVGELSTHAQYSVYSPEQLMQQFLEDARHE
jgi:hypothetical protein